ncbi:MAG: hypothetical protein A2W91_09970 [Bacteroidetes bacterium GWF2_38_335]|nr:MAG: hypothetical protein A2W91_09970 [Bacteroidetes bacterium GWF2_38_335]HBS88046.1 hypothetical protein [Bacteroidales bacterium]
MISIESIFFKFWVKYILFNRSLITKENFFKKAREKNLKQKEKKKKKDIVLIKLKDYHNQIDSNAYSFLFAIALPTWIYLQLFFNIQVGFLFFDAHSKKLPGFGYGLIVFLASLPFYYLIKKIEVKNRKRIIWKVLRGKKRVKTISIGFFFILLIIYMLSAVIVMGEYNY